MFTSLSVLVNIELRWWTALLTSKLRGYDHSPALAGSGESY